MFVVGFLKKVSMNLNGKIRFNSGSEIPQLAQVALEGRIYSINDALKIYRVHDDSLFNQERNQASLLERLFNHLNIYKFY